MWASLELRVRALLRRAAAAFGTLPLSAALAVLLVVRCGGVEAWHRLGTLQQAERFATSWSAWLLAMAVVADAVVHLTRTLPAALRASRASSGGGRARLEAALGPLLATAWLLVGAGALTSLAARDSFTLSAGVDELVDGRAGQVVARAEPRPLSRGPGALSFSVDTVAPTLDREGRLEALSVGVNVRGKSRRATLRWPVWLGGSRFLRATGYGYAPGFEVLDPKGRVVDSAFVKLDLVPAGRRDEIRSAVLPHRFVLRAVPTGGARSRDRGLAFDVEVYRDRLLVASGRIPLGGRLAFEGLTFAIPETNFVARLELVDDPGWVLLAAAGAIALLALALWLAAPGR